MTRGAAYDESHVASAAAFSGVHSTFQTINHSFDPFSAHFTPPINLAGNGVSITCRLHLFHVTSIYTTKHPWWDAFLRKDVVLILHRCKGLELLVSPEWP